MLTLITSLCPSSGCSPLRAFLLDYWYQKKALMGFLGAPGSFLFLVFLSGYFTSLAGVFDFVCSIRKIGTVSLFLIFIFPSVLLIFQNFITLSTQKWSLNKILKNRKCILKYLLLGADLVTLVVLAFFLSAALASLFLTIFSSFFGAMF